MSYFLVSQYRKGDADLHFDRLGWADQGFHCSRLIDIFHRYSSSCGLFADHRGRFPASEGLVYRKMVSDEERTTVSLSSAVPQIEPSSYSLLLNWTPTLRYYEYRLQPLVRLEAEGSLLSYRVQPDSVGARLQGIELTLNSTSLALNSLAPIGGPECAPLLEELLDAVRPKTYQRVAVMFQYVIPFTGTSYDDARMKGLEGINDANLASVGAYDFAFTISGRGDGVEWQLEAGIVSADEIEQRVQRRVGAFGQFAGSGFVNPEQASKPEVAFFSDSMWQILDRPPPDGACEWILGKVAMIEDQARRVMPEVLNGITHRSSSQEGASI